MANSIVTIVHLANYAQPQALMNPMKTVLMVISVHWDQLKVYLVHLVLILIITMVQLLTIALTVHRVTIVVKALLMQMTGHHQLNARSVTTVLKEHPKEQLIHVQLEPIMIYLESNIQMNVQTVQKATIVQEV